MSIFLYLFYSRYFVLLDTTFMDNVKTIDGAPEPFYDFVDTVPTVPMSVIIDGVFKYLCDNTANGILYHKKKEAEKKD